ncbi:hypothetical protein ACTMU2_27000 [Cupriavidus basilensis]
MPAIATPDMPYRRLGASNLKVSRLCLGTMMFADQTDEAEAARIVASARAWRELHRHCGRLQQGRVRADGRTPVGG